MESNDWLMKQLQILPKKIPALVQHSREPLLDVLDELTGEIYSVPISHHLLKLIINLEINQAETILFAQFPQLSDAQIMEISTWFYTKLETLTARELEEADFTKEEIDTGKEDVGRLLHKRQ